MMEKGITIRPQRNRRHSRRAWPPEDDVHRPRLAKRLFTPEIKRMLKDWLIRRRDNPYPSRDEKKRLAIETGLTYTQICNWFANWRRKLKNSERERVRKSWGHLIKNYNTNARGNVEQFSISSEDSIWEEKGQQRKLRYKQNQRQQQQQHEQEFSDNESQDDNTTSTELEYIYNDEYTKVGLYNMKTIKMKHSNFYPTEVNGEHGEALDVGVHTTAQCYQVSSTTCEPARGESGNNNYINTSPNFISDMNISPKTNQSTQSKYKQKIMEKYMRDMTEEQELNRCDAISISTTPVSPASGAELSKWLESAAKFTPNKNNYFFEWNYQKNKLEKKQQPQQFKDSSDFLDPSKMVYTPIVQRENQQLTRQQILNAIHHKDELDAAEALTSLAFNCRQRIMDGSTNNNSNIPMPINAMSS